MKKDEKGIVQYQYFEHAICSQDDLSNYINYIHYNPVKHEYTKFIKDWKYSSFHKYLENNLYNKWEKFD